MDKSVKRVDCDHIKSMIVCMNEVKLPELELERNRLCRKLRVLRSGMNKANHAVIEAGRYSVTVDRLPELKETARIARRDYKRMAARVERIRDEIRLARSKRPE